MSFPARKGLSIKILFSILSLPIFFWPGLALASATDIIITEINYDPSGADEGKEWVELYNSGTDSATLIGGSLSSSWKINDGSNHNLATTAARGSMTILGGEYVVIAQNDNNFIYQYPSYSGSVIRSSGLSLGNSLHDEDEVVALRIGTAGSLWSQVTYKRNWGGAGNGRTLEKKSINGINDSSNWVEGPINGGTPGEAYSSPSYPSEIYLSEYLPYPESGNEWVEIYNGNSESKILTGWQIDDVAGGSSPKNFSSSVPGKGFLKIELVASFFNNGGDSVRLLRPDGTVADETSFTLSYKANAFARDSGNSWQETTKPTPGEVNVINSPVHSLTVTEIKKLITGTRISTEAFVTTPPDLLGDNDFYIHDPTGGIKVHCTCSLSSTSFGLEDKIKISSSIEESDSEKYIKTDSVSVLEKNQPQTETDTIGTGELNEANEGNLVKITGLVDHLDGTTFFLNDGSGLAKVYIKDSTGVVRPDLESGQLVRVIGLVSQAGNLKDGSANYRLLPRYKGDIEILSVTKEELAARDSGVGGQVLGAVTQLPATGPGDDSVRFGFFFLFLGLNLRLYIRCHFPGLR